MNLQQAYIKGFFKQAAAYGLSESEAVGLYQKYGSELKGDQHKLDVDKDGKIEAEDLKKLRQRKQAAETAPLTAPGTPDTNIMNSLKGLMSSGSSAVTPAQATVPAAPAATMNDRILKAMGMAPTGIPASRAGAYSGVLGKNPQAGGAKAVPAPGR